MGSFINIQLERCLQRRSLSSVVGMDSWGRGYVNRQSRGDGMSLLSVVPASQHGPRSRLQRCHLRQRISYQRSQACLLFDQSRITESVDEEKRRGFGAAGEGWTVDV